MTGVPWWWVGATHNLEGSGNFATYLGNGQALTMRTTIVPKGRGPFKSFEAGAVDSLKLHNLDDIDTWTLPRALYEAERWNGWGYLGKVNSPYIWSGTDLYERGKYVKDHVYSATAVSEQVGVAAVLKVLETMGVLIFNKQEAHNEMADEQTLKASLLPFGALAPILIKTLAGGAASYAVKALAEAFDDDKPEPKAAAVKQKLEDTPIAQIPEILAGAEAILQALFPPSGAQTSVPAVPVAGPGTIGGSVSVHDIEPGLTPSTPTVIVKTEPAPAPTPAVVVEPKEGLGKVDQIFGGEALAGLKAPIAIILYCGAWAFGPGALGYITPEIQSAVYALATGIGGISLTAKFDKVLSSPLLNMVVGTVLKRK